MDLTEIISDDVEWIAPEASVADAVERFARAPAGAVCLLVGDGHAEPRGIVTAFDLLRAAECTAVKPGRVSRGGAVAETVRPEDLSRPAIFDEMACAGAKAQVREVMSSPVACVQAHASLAEVMDLLIRRRIDAVPVLRGARVAGIVHRRGLVDALARAMGARRA